MKRRGFLLALASAIGLSPRGTAAYTEVHHGPDARFAAPLSGGVFTCTLVGRYTNLDNCGAGGVTKYCFDSSDPKTQNAELLVLRTAFLEWFREMYEKTGGNRQGAVNQVIGVAQTWLHPGYSPGALCPNSPSTLKAPPPAKNRCGR